MGHHSEFDATLEGRGLAGAIVYSEGGRSHRFSWEVWPGATPDFGVRMPSSADWEGVTGWGLDRRPQIVERIAVCVLTESRFGPYWQLTSGYLMFSDEDLEAALVAKLGPENASSLCRQDGCSRGRVRFSVFCSGHHIEQLRRADSTLDARGD